MRRRERRVACVGALAVAAAVLGLGAATAPLETLVHPDTVRDLLLAKECAFGRTCESAGVSSLGLMHGFAWPGFLSLLLRAGLDPARLPLVVLGIHAAGASVLFLLLRHVAGTVSGALLVGVYVLATVHSDLTYPLWNPTLVPFVAVVLIGSTAVYLRAPMGKQWPAFLLACLAFALGSEIHLEVLFFFPGVAFALVCAPARGLKATLLAATVAVAWVLVSPGALSENVASVLSPRRAWISDAAPGTAALDVGASARLAVHVAVVAAFTLVLRRGGAGRRGATPLEAFCVVSVVGYLSAILVAVLLRRVEPRYLQPVVPFTMLLVASTLRRLTEGRAGGAGVPRVLAVALCLVGLGVGSRRPDAMPLRDVRTIVSLAGEAGSDARGLYRRVGSDGWTFEQVIGGVWLDVPCLFGELVVAEAPRDGDRLLVLRGPDGVARRPAIEARRPRVRRSTHGEIVVVRHTSYLESDRYALCREGEDPLPSRCAEHSRTRFYKSAGVRCWDAGLPAYATTEFARLPEPTRGPFTVTIPLRLPAGAGERRIHVPAATDRNGRRGRCPGRIVRLHSLSGHIENDGRVARFPSGSEAQNGTVEISWPFGDDACSFRSPWVRFPLPVVEMDAELHDAVRDLLE